MAVDRSFAAEAIVIGRRLNGSSETMQYVTPFGHPYHFQPSPWTDIEQRYEQHAVHSYLLDIVRSVLASDAVDLLAGTTWMWWDLAVVTRPVPEPPLDVIVVRDPYTPFVPAGLIRIEHRSVNGRDDVIDRPPEDAVRLFWRFVGEKYGISSGHEG
jgi:hypothetical protein